MSIHRPDGTTEHYLSVPADYRLRISTGQGPSCRTYFTRTDGRTSYVSSSETPLALSNLLQEDAAETRFLLQDAKDGRVAADHLRKVLHRRWSRNMSCCPTVELMP